MAEAAVPEEVVRYRVECGVQAGAWGGRMEDEHRKENGGAGGRTGCREGRVQGDCVIQG